MKLSVQWPPTSCCAHVYTLFGATSEQTLGEAGAVAAGDEVATGVVVVSGTEVAAGVAVSAGEEVAAGVCAGLLVAAGDVLEGQRPQVAAQ